MVSVCSHPKLFVVLSKPLFVLPTVSEGFESESFYNSRVGGWEISLTAQRFDPPALKISPSGREDKDPIAGLGAPTPHYSKEERKKS